MSYKIKTVPYFDKQAKRLTRKFQSFKIELSELFDSLGKDPTQGIYQATNRELCWPNAEDQ